MRNKRKKRLAMLVCAVLLTLSTSGVVYARDSAFKIYISGIDSRNGLTDSSLSDVNIIATINPDTKQVLLVSTPRDYYVPLSISDGVPDKLTHAGTYGVEVSRDTLEMLYDTEIDYYFRIDFQGFESVIDALGGITVISDYEFDSQNITGYHFNEGENYLNGEEALVFARERYAFAEGDRQRGNNQMAVIKGVMNKVMEDGLFKNALTLLKEMDGSYETDVPITKMISIAGSLLGDESLKLTSYAVDGTGASEVTYSGGVEAYVMIPDQATVDQAKEMMEKVENGEMLE